MKTPICAAVLLGSFCLLIRPAFGAAAAPAANATAQPVLAATPPATLVDKQAFRLWAGPAPLANGENATIDIPNLTVFTPAEGKANGAIMVICPGGGYQHLSMDKEGSVVAQWLAGNGVTAFVLQYRLGMKYHYPAEFDDVERAIRTVRANAPAWKLDPNRVGIMGFSAGGHLASTAATHYDSGNATAEDPVEKVGSRPNLQVLVYPVITLTDEPNVHKGSRTYLLGNNPPADLEELLSNEKHVTKDSPPAFIVHSTADKTVPVANSDNYVAALMKNNVGVVFLRGDYGGHGFGLTDAWRDQCAAWLKTQKF